MHLFIKYRLSLGLLISLLSIALVIHSCKKDNSDTVAFFLTSGTWKLASVTVTNYIGNTQTNTYVLNANCTQDQIFQFKADNSCTYSNYHCIAQNSAGQWALTSDDLMLQTTLSAQDTLTGGTLNPQAVNAFQNAQIVNLGQYSLVLETGDISPYYTTTTPRKIVRYGFIHP